MSDVLKIVNPEASMLALNIEYAASLNLPFVPKNLLRNRPGAVVCGTGPTLTGAIREIRALARKGYAIFAVKQSIRILTDLGIKVDYSVAMDPTERQIRKTPVVEGVTYCVASTCHPRMFDYLLNKNADVLLCHSASGAQDGEIGELDLYDKYFEGVPGNEFVASGGYTVVNRAVSVAEYMGAKRIYIAGAPFGWREGAGYYEGSVKEPAGNASGPTLDDKGQIDGKTWYSKADLMPSAVSLALKAKANPAKYYFMGDSLAAALAARSYEFIERVLPTK